MSVQDVPERVAIRVMSKVAMGPRGCHISTYSVASHGYAQIGWNEGGERHVTLCHRVIWNWFRGPIPKGMTVDHMCKTRRCVRLQHLRLIPNLENARRTSGRDWELGQCINGHPDEQHWRPIGPGRVKGYCSACRAEQAARRDPAAARASDARYRAKKRSQRAA